MGQGALQLLSLCNSSNWRDSGKLNITHLVQSYEMYVIGYAQILPIFHIKGVI